MERTGDWWEHPALLAALVVAAAAPLLWPAIPPLVDLPGHIGRLHVADAIATSPYLKQWFAYRWALVGNLGVDVIAIPLGHLIGLELAVKAIMIAVAALTAASMLWLAREIHGRVPPTAAFALPLVLCFPFMFGFANYVLGIALMFGGLALWVRLARLGRTRLRFACFVPIAFVTFVAHGVAWGMLGVAAFAFEWADLRRAGFSPGIALLRAAIAIVPLALPGLLLVGWLGQHVEGPPLRWSTISAKYYFAMAILRNDDELIDVTSARLLYGLIVLGIGGLVLRVERRLGAAALALFVAFLIMPGTALGSFFSDMRIIPYAVALALLALTPKDGMERWRAPIAAAAILFALARFAVSGATLYRVDRTWSAQLAALDHVSRGSRVFVLANVPCADDWRQPRVDHLGSMAIARRDSFANGQWPMPGGRLLSITYAPARNFALDPSQELRPARCRQPGSYSMAQATAQLPRAAFDYMWLIDVPPAQWPTEPWLAPVWRGRTGILYRVAR
ncbi:hypothetical protein [Sphingomonas montanisoli]|uniref:Glycosyltransferase RgtA/B/C/D-like domain-containing protein n=1 Tax=Sphingomonas montanisoli TaxID=2606412 RepID=A0A5D9BZA9_9SPHN|nr:hypothetical protein [Sphingomonas montanisoli]TZG24928.1 hypothetical protein FYJ91_16755 [Sphingomonas montanisoli]